jgi:hypothetical protein
VKLVYLAHPLAAKRHDGSVDRIKVLQNIKNARLWYKWACDRYWPDHCFNAMWILNVEVYNDANKVDRDRGMQRNFHHIKRCDELWLLGPHISLGMEEEAQFARRCLQPVYDLTNGGLTNPYTIPRLESKDMMLWKPGSLTQQTFNFAKPPGV